MSQEDLLIDSPYTVFTDKYVKWSKSSKPLILPVVIEHFYLYHEKADVFDGDASISLCKVSLCSSLPTMSISDEETFIGENNFRLIEILSSCFCPIRSTLPGFSSWILLMTRFSFAPIFKRRNGLPFVHSHAGLDLALTRRYRRM